MEKKKKKSTVPCCLDHYNTSGYSCQLWVLCYVSCMVFHDSKKSRLQRQH